MAKNLFFLAHKESSAYSHAKIRVFAADPQADHRDGIKFTWQTDDGEDHWYAFTVSVEANSLEQLNAKVRLVRRVLGKEMYNVQPDTILDKLSRIAVEVVYDSRVSQFVPLDEVSPVSMKSWRDDWRTMGRSSCTVGCLAETVEEAQDEILLKLAKSKHYREYLVAWLAAGKPVVCLGYKRPDTTPAREKLALSFQNDN